MSGSVTFTMLQLVLLLIANSLRGTIGQRRKVEWPGDEPPPTGGQDYCRCCNTDGEGCRPKSLVRFNASDICEPIVIGLNDNGIPFFKHDLDDIFGFNYQLSKEEEETSDGWIIFNYRLVEELLCEGGEKHSNKPREIFRHASAIRSLHGHRVRGSRVRDTQ